MPDQKRPDRQQPEPLAGWASYWKRYSVPILSVAGAAVLTYAVQVILRGRAPLIFFSIAVILSASAAGIAGGLLATGLSVILAYLLFQDHTVAVLLTQNSLALFAIFGAAATLIIEKLHDINSALSRAKTDLEATNTKLSERTEALYQANEELQRFAYSLAHDLNTPLRSISALTDLLVQRNKDRIDESSKECASLIVNTVMRMQRLIKGLLDYATAVEKPDERTPVDCKLAVERAVADLDSVIRMREAQVIVDPLPTVHAVEAHLVQVFLNLISNGIKYCPMARAPMIHISAGADDAEWKFCVKDNGIGLDMRYASDIFGMFKRLHGGEYEGTGIGLALCKVVVQRHGGRIWVESELGKGSCFYFTLPKESDVPAAGTHQPAAGTISEPSPFA